MRAESKKTKLKLFFGGLLVCGILISSFIYKNKVPSTSLVSTQPLSPSLSINEHQERGKDYRTRYLNLDAVPKSTKKIMAIACVSEAGEFSRSLESLLVGRLKFKTVELRQHLFTKQFVSDGMFAEAFLDMPSITKKLDMFKSVEFLLLTRQTVQYSTNNALENVITANMQTDISAAHFATAPEYKVWSIEINGAGFTASQARSMAEERFVNQMKNDTNIIALLNESMTN